MSTHETGTCLAANSSILAIMACSLTFVPSESQVHQPKPRNDSGRVCFHNLPKPPFCNMTHSAHPRISS